MCRCETRASIALDAIRRSLAGMRICEYLLLHECEVQRRPPYRRYRGISGSNNDIVNLMRMTDTVEKVEN
jgi:hypothetical protein